MQKVQTKLLTGRTFHREKHVHFINLCETIKNMMSKRNIKSLAVFVLGLLQIYKRLFFQKQLAVSFQNHGQLVQDVCVCVCVKSCYRYELCFKP